LEDALPKIACKKQGIGPPAAQGGKKPDMSDADVLRLVHHRKIEDRILVLRDRSCQ
jgi:hypothetical protein